MAHFRKYLFVITVLSLLVSCKGKKKPSLDGDDPVDVNDFVEFFQPVKLPYGFNDSLLQKKENDSLRISQKVFTQFVPDSILTTIIGKGAKPKIYPLGKASSKTETYLFAKTVNNNSKTIFILCFDKKNQFVAALPVLKSETGRSVTRTALMDAKYSITKSSLRINSDRSLSEGKDVYIMNTSSRSFMLIMTDALDDRITELINPIDTIARKHKLSADYSTNAMNLVSIRDGRKSDRLTFFIHIEKSNGDCTGELKGEAMIKSPTLAEYRLGGDPCVLQFRFSGTAVTLKEIEGCGSHRTLRCSFDGSFPRKKEAKPTKAKVIGKK